MKQVDTTDLMADDDADLAGLFASITTSTSEAEQESMTYDELVAFLVQSISSGQHVRTVEEWLDAAAMEEQQT